MAALGVAPGRRARREGRREPERRSGLRRRGNGDLRVRLYVTGDAPLLVAPAAAVLAEHGSSLADVKLGTPTLEDVFIHLTGRTLR